MITPTKLYCYIGFGHRLWFIRSAFQQAAANLKMKRKQYLSGFPLETTSYLVIDCRSDCRSDFLKTASTYDILCEKYNCDPKC